MSEVMLHGILNMPIDIWSDDILDKRQRHSRYVEASKLIREQEGEINQLRQKLEAAEAECARLKEENHNALLSYVELINKREIRVSGLQDRVREALDRASCPAAFMNIAIDTIGLHGCGEIADTCKRLELAEARAYKAEAMINEAKELKHVGYGVEVYYQSMIDPADCGEGLSIYSIEEFEKTDICKDDENVFRVFAL